MDKKLLYLWQKVEEENINVLFHQIKCPPDNLLAAYINRPGMKPSIILDNSLRYEKTLFRCIFAEEVGHHMMGVSTNFFKAERSYRYELHRGRDEIKAMRWATDVLIPDIELYLAIKRQGLAEVYELAEYFNVTIPFMMDKLKFVKSTYRWEEKVKRQLGKLHIVVVGGREFEAIMS